MFKTHFFHVFNILISQRIFTHRIPFCVLVASVVDRFSVFQAFVLTRLAEHKRYLRPANLAKVDDNNFNKKTALVKHVITKDRRVNWDHSKILTFETDFTKRQFLESFYIHNSENAINDNENCFYSAIYDIWRNLRLGIIRF